MALKFPCSECGREMRTDGLAVGQSAKCPLCGAKVLVPPTTTLSPAPPTPREQESETPGERETERPLQRRRSDKLATTLHVLGLVAIALGLSGGLALLSYLSEPTPVSPEGELIFVEGLIAFAFAFYNSVLGMLCIGVARSLTRASP